jgi:uncharacterized protein (UPF0276 family)
LHHAHGASEELRRYAPGRILSGHGIGLSLPSDMPLDEALAEKTAALAAEFGFGWFSEHLSVFLTPHGSVPNAQAGLGLPMVYDDESFAIIAAKLARLRQKFACPLLLENGSIFTQIPDMDATEPKFLNRLHREAGYFTLPDLHNLYVTARNGGDDPDGYLDAIDPACVMEIHLGGGDELAEACAVTVQMPPRPVPVTAVAG